MIGNNCDVTIYIIHIYLKQPVAIPDNTDNEYDHELLLYDSLKIWLRSF